MNEHARPPGATFLRLVDDEWVLRALRTLPGLDRMSAYPVQDMTKLPSADASVAPAFAVSGISKDGPIRLSSVVPVQAVHWPPLLVLTQRVLAGWEQEHLRRQGVSAIVSLVDSPLPAQRIVEALARSSEWFGAKLSRAPLADLLQMLAADGRSGMIWVGCPHNAALSRTAWEDGGEFCTGPQCPGWAARLHLHAGRLVYAETPTLHGLDAFSKCLTLTEGFVRVHEVYMAPRRANLDGTVQQLLISAAAIADERGRDRDYGRAATKLSDSVRTNGLAASPDSGAFNAPARVEIGLEASLTADLEAAAALTAAEASPPLALDDRSPTDPSTVRPRSASQFQPPPLPKSARAAPIPLVAAPNPLTAHPNPLTAHPNSLTVDPNPLIPEPNPLIPEPNPLIPEPDPLIPEPDPLNPEPNPASGSAKLADLLGGPADVRLAVDTDDEGSVAHVEGEGDADSAAAVATLCRSAFDSAGAELGMGRVERWCVLGSANAMYAKYEGGRARLALGTASTNAFSNLVRLFEKDTP